MRAIRTLLEGGFFFEGPRWHDGRWWVSDVHGHVVLSVGADGESEEVLTVDGRPSGLGWLADGSLLVVSMLERRLLRRRPTGETTVHAELAGLCRGYANDMVVDEHGRAYVGSRGYEDGEPVSSGDLIRVDPDGSAQLVARELAFPNGAVITPDGRTLIVGESTGCRYTAFTIDRDGGLLDRRLWAQLTPGPPSGPLDPPARTFAPDGCALDAAGCIWSADPLGGRYCRLARGGAILEELAPPPGTTAVACMLGGEAGRTLLLCAAPTGPRARETRAGVLLTTTVDVPHAGLP